MLGVGDIAISFPDLKFPGQGLLLQKHPYHPPSTHTEEEVMGSEAPMGLQPSLGRENLRNGFEHRKSMSLPSHPS